MQLSLAPTHVQERDHWQQRKRQAQQAFADERRQQLLDHLATVEQPTQLPVAAAQGHCQYGVFQVIRG
ncbi:hypothetical protein D3C76_1618600 [compost metagenome]